MKNALTKRIFSLFLAVLMMASAMSISAFATDHTHTAQGEWISNGSQHWKLCSCGAVVDTTKSNHLAEGAWLNDATKHWRLCACGVVAVSAAHVDRDRNELCDDCLYNLHKHTAQGKWLADDTNHWKLCACGEVAVSAAHTENALGYCSVCSTYVHKHTAQGEWLKDNDNHWKKCKCGEVVDSAAHTDANDDEACDVCAVKIHKHVAVDRWLSDANNHWKLCACGVVATSGEHVDANTDKVCDVCAFDLASTVHTHAPQGNWAKDTLNHWLVCSCGEEKYYLAPHTIKNGVCEACGYVASLVNVGGSATLGNWSVGVTPDNGACPSDAKITTYEFDATASNANSAIRAVYPGASISSTVNFTINAANIKIGTDSYTFGGYTINPGEVIKVFGKDYVVDYISGGVKYVRLISLCDNKTVVYDTYSKTVQTVFENTVVKKVNTKAIVNGVEYDVLFVYGGSYYFLYKNGNPAGLATSVSANFYPGYDPASLAAKGSTTSDALASFYYGGKNYVVYDVFSKVVTVSGMRLPATLKVTLDLGSFRPVSVIGGVTNSYSTYGKLPVISNVATMSVKMYNSAAVAMFAVVESPLYNVTVKNITPSKDYYDCWWGIVYPSCKPTTPVFPSVPVCPGTTVCPGLPTCPGTPNCVVNTGKSFVIYATSNVGGIMSPAGSAVIACGKSMTYTFSPAEGFAISKVIVDGVNVGAPSSYTFKNVRSNHTIKVEFAKIKMPFLDVYTSDSYYKDVLYVWENDIMKGTTYTEFDPQGDITRAMIVTMLWRMEGCPASTGKLFSDVGSASYYADAVRWAAKNGIVCGYGDDTFRPNQNITREELAAILYRYLEFNGKGFVGAWAYKLGYKDSSAISDWAYEAVSYLTMKNVIVTESATVLNPGVDASRVEAAICIHRICELLK